MSDLKRVPRATGLTYIAEGFIQAYTDPVRASRALATKIAVFRPTRQELRELGVSDKQLQSGLELIRRNKRVPRQKQLADKFMSARSILLVKLSPPESTKRRVPSGRNRGVTPHPAH